MADNKTKKDHPGTSKTDANNTTPSTPEQKTTQAPREHFSETGNEIETTTSWSLHDVSREFDRRISEVSPMGFFGLALAAMGLSAAVQMVEERKRWSTFFGLWVPSFLFLGIYSKINSMQHSDTHSTSAEDDRPLMH